MTTTKNAKKGTRPGDGRLIRTVVERAVLAGKSTPQIIAAVKRSFPDARASATPSGVAYWRAVFRTEGKQVPRAAR